MPFPQPEGEPLGMWERVLFWALVTLPLIAASAWVSIARR